MNSQSRRTLLLLAAVCIVPVIAAYLSYFVIQPERRANYGDLIAPRPLPVTRFETPEGKFLDLAGLKGRWVLMTLDGSGCDERCRRKLYYMRQVRTAQGKEMNRIERVWLVTDDSQPAAALLSEYSGMHVARAAPSLIAALPATPEVSSHVYLIDPLGNLMLRFPGDPNPKRMIEDLSRLLKVSRIG